MPSTFIHKLRLLPLEEKILNGSLVLGIVGVCSPWISGQLSIIDDTSEVFSGLGFHTSFIGMAILGLMSYTLLITLMPLISGNPLVSQHKRNSIRVTCTAASTTLVLAALSVLLKYTFSAAGMDIRFGIYITLFASIASTFYAYLTLQAEKRKRVQELFHHPDLEQPDALETTEPSAKQMGMPLQGSAPPPPPSEPEKHTVAHR